MTIFKQKWVVLFGGAGREICVERMFEAGIKIELVVVPVHRSKKLEAAVQSLRKLPISIIEIDRDGLSDLIRPYSGLALLSIGYPHILSEDLLNSFEPAVNLHPTLLPKYRGPTTGAYVLINGESATGSTVHIMTKRVDQGPIVRQNHIEISPFDTIISLRRKVYKEEPKLLLLAIQDIENGIQPTPQDENAATEFPNRRFPSDSEIDPRQSLLDLMNQIRACDPEDFPAFFFYHGEKVNVTLCRQNKPTNDSEMI